MRLTAFRNCGTAVIDVTASVTLDLEDDMHPFWTPFLTPRTSMARPRNLEGANTKPRVGVDLLRRWIRASAKNWKRRKMIAALQSMDDLLLKDIGVDRSEIIRIVDGFDDRELDMVPVGRTSRETHERKNAVKLAA